MSSKASAPTQPSAPPPPSAPQIPMAQPVFLSLSALELKTLMEGLKTLLEENGKHLEELKQLHKSHADDKHKVIQYKCDICETIKSGTGLIKQFPRWHLKSYDFDLCNTHFQYLVKKNRMVQNCFTPVPPISCSCRITNPSLQ